MVADMQHRERQKEMHSEQRFPPLSSVQSKATTISNDKRAKSLPIHRCRDEWVVKQPDGFSFDGAPDDRRREESAGRKGRGYLPLRHLVDGGNRLAGIYIRSFSYLRSRAFWDEKPSRGDVWSPPCDS